MTIIILTILAGVITGILSGMLGIGGGAIMVVIMISLLGVTQHIAQAAALAAIIPTAFVGAAKHHKNGLINYKVGIYLAIGGVIGSLIGANCANILSEDILCKVFSVFFAIIGIQLLITSVKTVEKNKI
ncbi:sulfite exporter TauE/SafE family protein [Clostridium beijerinckii]|uniref:Probable membrane transporter protein n=1 Tax=Clostridium beijerinckii TaxID=1520 RepID=A0A7X9SNN3_CLOBE|nr:sulfite exporter TauE/SafE family protein [Clostridium beijerinckii]NMF05250.1 sulfite exporter TauE/SafE family protein [Clostridium beijerinckii]